MDFVIRPLTAGDEPILWEMLYQALHTSEGGPRREVIRQPEFARYVEGWGRAADSGFIASDAKTGEVLGAVWIRRLSDQPEAPSDLAFGVKLGLRRRGSSLREGTEHHPIQMDRRQADRRHRREFGQARQGHDPAELHAGRR